MAATMSFTMASKKAMDEVTETTSMFDTVYDSVLSAAFFMVTTMISLGTSFVSLPMLFNLFSLWIFTQFFCNLP